MAHAPREYRARWFVFDNATGESTLIGETASRSTTLDAPPDLPGRAGVYIKVQLRGHDPTGKSVRDGYFAATPAAAEFRYETVCDTRQPYYDEDSFQVVDRYVSEANLFLPLSDDDQAVNKILVFSINRDLYRK